MPLGQISDLFYSLKFFIYITNHHFDFFLPTLIFKRNISIDARRLLNEHPDLHITTAAYEEALQKR